MSEKKIVTISRQYGSGGRYIGRLLAEKLGVPFYDKDIIHIAAKESGLSAEIMERMEETSSTRYLFMQRIAPDEESLQPNMSYSVPDLVYLAKSKAIRMIAEQGPCVIVGRCADYILRERDDVFNVFVHADDDYRARHVLEAYGEMPGKTIEERLEEKDKKRALYYRHYTDREWGDLKYYDLTINTARIPLEMACKWIVQALRE